MQDLVIEWKEDGTHLYEQIYQYIRDEIRRGKLLCQEKLPSTRSLAEYLQVSRSTVELAYDQLVAEGYLEAVPYKGYFVARVEELYQMETAPDAGITSREQAGSFSRADAGGDCLFLSGAAHASEAALDDSSAAVPVQIDFSPNAIDMRNFPFDLWRKVNRNVLNLNNRDLFLPGDPMGDLSLRRTISRYLHASRGVTCRPEQIVVGAGNDYLLMLLRYVFEKTITAAFENPTYPRAWKIFQLFAGEVVTVSSDASGICIEELEKSGAQVVYVMPSHQYPTGRMMPIGRRTELLNWAAREKERYIIEDDYDSEFRYRGKPVPSLQASDAAGKVIYMGTFSKSIAPAIRVGYMVLPEALLERYRQKCACFSCTVSRVDQAVLEQFLDSGAFERHLNRMRKSYSRKHEALLDGLKPFFRQFDLSGENAGLHLLLTDRIGRSEKELVDAARRQGVKVYGLSSALVGAAVPEAVCRATVLIGFGGLTEDEIRNGLERLAAAWLIEKRL